MALDTKRLLRIGLAKGKEQSAWLEGISLERAAGQTIDQLRCRVVASRFSLAKEMRNQSSYSPLSSMPIQRLTISRSYYVMYHSIRAAAYLFYLGDDHQQHSELPQKVPNDFPNHAVWANQLKSAREYRNQADYDPYPKSVTYWRNIAATVYADAGNLMPVVAAYLRGKGCRI